MDSSLRTTKDIALDFVLGMLFVIWYVVTVTFPAFHFQDFESKKSVVVAVFAPAVFFIMVIARLFRKKKSVGNLLTAFFLPDAGPIENNPTERFAAAAVGWIGILLAPTLGSFSAEKHLGLELYSSVFWIGSLPIALAGVYVIRKRMEFLNIIQNEKFYTVCGALLVWWTWAELINIIELLDRAPWVFLEVPHRLSQLLGI
jgi:hypothetical protein